MKNKILIIKVLLALVGVFIIVNFYISFILPPGNIDFYIKGNKYQNIVDKFYLPQFNNIRGIYYNKMYFNDWTSCGLKENQIQYICPEQYYSLLKEIKSTHIKDMDIDFKKGTIKIQNYGSNSALDDGYKYYLYKKSGFSEEEKKAKNVIKVINDNWLIAVGYISAPGN